MSISVVSPSICALLGSAPPAGPSPALPLLLLCPVVAALALLLQRWQQPRPAALLRRILHEGPPPGPLPPRPPPAPSWPALRAQAQRAAGAGDLEGAAGVLAAGADLRRAHLAILDEEHAGAAEHTAPGTARAARPRGRRRRAILALFPAPAPSDLPELPAGELAGMDLDDDAILASIPPPPPLGLAAEPIPELIPVPTPEPLPMIRSGIEGEALPTVADLWPLVIRPRRTTRPLWPCELAELQAAAGAQS